MRKLQFFLALLLILPLLSAILASAQPPPDFLRISASPGLVSFSLRPTGVTKGSLPVAITTTWRIQRGGTTVNVYAYFSSPPAALANASGGAIPSSKIFGRVNASSFLPFTGTSPLGAGGSLLIFSQQVKGNKDATRNDSLDMQIDTTGLNLTPGTYSGSLRIQALAL